MFFEPPATLGEGSGKGTKHGAENGKGHPRLMAGFFNTQTKQNVVSKRTNIVQDETPSNADHGPSKRTRSQTPAPSPSYAASTSGGKASSRKNREEGSREDPKAADDVNAEIQRLQTPLSPRNANVPGRTDRREGVHLPEGVGVADRANQGQSLNAAQMVKFEKAKAKLKEYKVKIGILDRENKDLRTLNLSLEKSLADMRDRYELPDFLKPKYLRKVAKRVISAFLRGDQFYSDLYPAMDTVYKVFHAEMKLAHSGDRRRFKDLWDKGYGQQVMTNLGDRRSKLGGRFRMTLSATVACHPVIGCLETADEAAEKKAIKEQCAKDRIWIIGPNIDLNPETGEEEVENDEGFEAEPLKGQPFRIAYAATMGGLYKDPMVGRPDVFAYFACVGQYFFEGRTMSSTNVEKDRAAVRIVTEELVQKDAATPGGLKYARLVKKRDPPDDPATCHFSEWRIRKAGEVVGDDAGAARSDSPGGADGDDSSDDDF